MYTNAEKYVYKYIEVNNINNKDNKKSINKTSVNMKNIQG